jgi:tetratricopeptide (TPR) repeat protein
MKANEGSTRFTPWALAVFLVALALRALHLWQLRASPLLTARLGDAATYDKWARGIANGDWLGREVFIQAPLYPYFLGTLYASVGDDPLLVRGFQCLLSALGCALLASAAASLFSRGAGLAAGLLLATYAPSIFLDALIQKSVLDLLFVCLALWLAARLTRMPDGRGAAALGVTLGLLALARENALLLASVMAAWLLLLPGVARARRVALAGVFAAGLAAALFPVALRNWWVGGELHLTSSQFGVNLYIGNHPGATGGYEPLHPGHGVEFERQDTVEMAERAAGRRLSPSEVSAYWTDQALAYVRSQPADWLRLMARKLVLLLGSMELVDSEDQYATAGYSSVLRAAGWLGRFGVLAPLAVLGVFVTWPRRRELWWIHAAIVTYAASVLLFYVFARYRYPLVPFLALLAGAGLAGARGWVVARGWREVAACAALVLALAALSNGVMGMSKASMAAVTHANLANSLRLEGKLELAAEHYRKALALDPDREDAADNLAATLRALGRPGDEIDVYEAGLAANPRDPRRHNKLAGLRRARGETVRAIEHYRRSLELDPDNGEARGGLAELYVESASLLAKRGEAAGALERYRSALALQPEAPAALWGAAWILATQRDAALRRPAEALALAERAAALSEPLTAPMLETLAAAYAAEGRMEQALASAREAAALHASAGRPVPRRLALALAAYERGEPLRLPQPAADESGGGF